MLLVKGTFRRDRHGDPNQKAKVEIPESWNAPEFLDEAAVIEWDRIVDLYARLNIITQAHLKPLVAYCVLASKLTRNPEAFTGADHSQLRAYAASFGFTPVDSDRITVLTDKSDRFANLGHRPNCN